MTGDCAVPRDSDSTLGIDLGFETTVMAIDSMIKITLYGCIILTNEGVNRIQ